jgi:hypothetical protein
MTLARLLSTCLLLSAFATAPLHAETFEVTRADDPAPDGCLVDDCSLREALDAAQATPEADTVLLDAGQYFFSLGELVVVGHVTLVGAGMEQTTVIGPGGVGILRVAAQSTLVAERLGLVSGGGTVLRVDGDHGALTLREVKVPADGGEIAAGDDGSAGTVELNVERSRIESVIGCIAADGTCRASDSVVGMFAAVGERIALRLERVEVVGPVYGVFAIGGGEVTIRDSTIRDTAAPLTLTQSIVATAADVWISRTRFLHNGGPLAADRDAMIHLDDVEFRDNVVNADNLDQPAVLLAKAGPAWRINRALFVGNRGGGGLDGAVVRVLGGANVVMNQVTFDDNTFHPDANGVFGHTIGVYANSADPTILWMFHATMRKASSLPDGTQGSLLTVRGGTANVRLFNSVVAGSCAFGSGGAVFQAEGNIESPADTCGLATGSNEVGMAYLQLHLGALGDHGGFTHTYEPTLGSFLIDQAKETWCLFSPLDQRRHLRPAGGIACDIGAVESGAVADTIFEDGFGP